VEYFSKKSETWIPAVISVVHSDGTFGLLGKDGTLVKDRADTSRLRLVRKSDTASSNSRAAPKSAPRVRVRVKGKKTERPKTEPEGRKPETGKPEGPKPETGQQDKPHAEEDQAPPAEPSFSLTRATAFARLGLQEGASSDDARRAYKQAALRWHPDRKQNHGREQEARVRFQEAKEAFDYLCGNLR